MADDKGELLPAEAFPPTGFPNVFADGVLSISNSSSIVKFYLFRFEPTYQGAGEAKAQAFAQVVMPLDSFAQTCVFFENTLANYVKGGLITEERLNELRKSFASNQAKP